MTARTRAQAHAKHAYYCTCGKVVRGNGGKASHEYMHERRGEWFAAGGEGAVVHSYVTLDAWRALHGGAQ